MAETTHQEQKVHRIYLGEGKAEKPSPEKNKADTLYNKHMQEVFDVILPEAISERQDVVEAQGEIATVTAELLLSKKNAWEHYKEHKNIKQFIEEQDQEWRGRELPHKLDRILTMAALGGSSALINFGTTAIGEKVLSGDPLLPRKEESVNPLKADESDSLGNKKAIKAGWELIAGKLIGSFANRSVQEATNRKGVGFVSPLSESLSNIGNIVISFAMPDWKERGLLQHAITGVVNPATVESGLRGLAAIPMLGAGVENAYIALNKSLMKEEGMLPFGFNLAATMLAAKESQMKRVKDMNKVIDVRQKPL